MSVIIVIAVRTLFVLKPSGLYRKQREWYLSHAVSVLVVALFGGAVAASDSIPTDCDTARDRAKSKYGAVRHYFDTFNLCVTRADGDVLQCEAALNAPQPKNVITTNKGPVVFAYDKLDQLARSNGRRFMIEGAIMSGTPIVSLMRMLPAAEYQSISGILNGTCNYILCKMEQDGDSFDEALKEAQRLGYAEADPSFDVGGGDARAKAIILTKLLKPLGGYDTDKIFLEGIEGITKEMVVKKPMSGP